MWCRSKKIPEARAIILNPDSKSVTLTQIAALNLHIFSFLSAKDVKQNSAVSTEFKTYCDYHANRSSTHYIVGSGLTIATVVMDSGSYLKERSEVPLQEIKNSFPKDGVVKVFASKYDASTYARSLRTSDPDYDLDHGDPIYQPAVFKVQYFLRHSIEQMEQKLVINPSQGRRIQPFNVTVRYFETNICNLIPIRGELRIDLHDNGKVKDYSTFDWEENAPQQAPRRCIVM
jgi:hypothetical protein